VVLKEKDVLDGDEVAWMRAELELTVLQLTLEGLHTTYAKRVCGVRLRGGR
jgi:hypothetical protein